MLPMVHKHTTGAKMKRAKRQIRAAHKAKTQRLQRMHAKRGSAVTCMRSKFVLSDAR